MNDDITNIRHVNSASIEEYCRVNDMVLVSRRRYSELMTNDEILRDLHSYITTIVSNSRFCRCCELKHPDNTCFFASECLANDFKHYTKNKEGTPDGEHQT